jgi:N-acetylneuraminic acid mutarotase
VLGAKLLLVGGTDASGRPLGTVLRIDPRSGAVDTAANLPTPLADAAAVTVENRVIVLGGTTPSPSDAVLAISECC